MNTWCDYSGFCLNYAKYEVTFGAGDCLFVCEHHLVPMIVYIGGTDNPVHSIMDLETEETLNPEEIRKEIEK